MIRQTALLLIIITLVLSLPAKIYAGPQSSSYELRQFGFGAGGVASASSSTYNLNGIAGEVSTQDITSSTYRLGPGLNATQIIGTPGQPTITNPSNYYNKLHVVLNDGGNPTDTVFTIAISTDAFSTVTRYILPDHTISQSITTANWQDYAGWGSTSGFDVIGLQPGTTYTIKVAAKQGDYTVSPWSQTAAVATVNPTMSFSLSPSSISSWNLTPGAIASAPSTATVTVSTNGNNGATVYIYDNKNGLQSTAAGHTIASVSNDLTAIGEGYGIRNTAVANGMQALPPYNSINSTTVGLLDGTERTIYDTNNTPATNASGTFELKAKPSSTAPPGSDYTDTITIISAAGF